MAGKKKPRKKSSQKRSVISREDIVKKAKKRTLQDKLQEVYSIVNLETSCCRQCVCCLTACPQMNYSEAVQILDHIWDTWSQDEKKKLLVKSVKYFFSNSVIKACPLLGKMDNGQYGCRVYEDRPLNCRMYGQWPEDMYEKRVEGFLSVTEMDRKEVPLNTQCAHVERVDENPLTEDMINNLYSFLDNIDLKIGTFTTKQVERNYNKRTIHDWVLAKFWGEERLTTMTDYFLAAKEEEVEDFVVQFEKVIQEQKI
jgi:Fe-S-cluster containining protein